MGSRGKEPDCDPIVELVTGLVRGTRWGRTITAIFGVISAIAVALSTYATDKAGDAKQDAETAQETAEQRAQREAGERAILEERFRQEQEADDAARQQLAGDVADARAEAAKRPRTAPNTETKTFRTETVREVPGPTVTASPRPAPPTPRPGILPPLFP